jgi:hypothetical protein
MTDLIAAISAALSPIGIPVYAAGDISDDRTAAYIMVDADITGGHDGLDPSTLADGSVTIGIYTSVTDDQTAAQCRAYTARAAGILSTFPLNGQYGDWYLRYIAALQLSPAGINDLFHIRTLTASTIMQSTAI